MDDGRETSEPMIPIDLIFEIFSRLPVKSIATCRCVSKLWASILSRPDFTELFLTRSSSRPQILFSGEQNGHLIFFSAPQLQNPDEKNLSLVTANYLMKFPFDYSFRTKICRPLHGLCCITNKSVSVICNLITGQSLPLPEVKSWLIHSNLGYDPIGKQFKVLAMRLKTPFEEAEHLVLTLGTRNLSWRMIKCFIPLYHSRQGICINGGLYFTSFSSNIGCFDVRSEKFRLITKPEDTWADPTLVNYKGKLGVYESDWFDRFTGLTGQNRSLELWVLELWVLVDADKGEWSKHVSILPPLWKYVVPGTRLSFVGVTGTNEIVLRSASLTGPFYVFYCNLEKETIKRVEIQGIDKIKGRQIHTFIDHVEDLQLLQIFRT